MSSWKTASSSDGLLLIEFQSSSSNWGLLLFFPLNRTFSMDSPLERLLRTGKTHPIIQQKKTKKKSSQTCLEEIVGPRANIRARAYGHYMARGPHILNSTKAYSMHCCWYSIENKSDKKESPMRIHRLEQEKRSCRSCCCCCCCWEKINSRESKTGFHPALRNSTQSTTSLSAVRHVHFSFIHGLTLEWRVL